MLMEALRQGATLHGGTRNRLCGGGGGSSGSPHFAAFSCSACRLVSNALLAFQLLHAAWATLPLARSLSHACAHSSAQGARRG